MCCILSHTACTMCGADSAATICCVTRSSIGAAGNGPCWLVLLSNAGTRGCLAWVAWNTGHWLGGDFLLIYRLDGNVIIFVRAGTHSALFEE